MPEILQPIGDRIVVERIEPETMRGSLYLPENAKRETFRARVLAVGPGQILDNGQRKPMVVQVDDLVLVAKHFSAEYEMDGRKVLVLGEGDALGVIKTIS